MFLFLDCEVDPSIGPNGNVNCTTVGTTRICRPFCNTNYDFDTVAYLDPVVCGFETGFVWNIKTEDNPTGQLPSCVGKHGNVSNGKHGSQLFVM